MLCSHSNPFLEHTQLSHLGNHRQAFQICSWCFCWSKFWKIIIISFISYEAIRYQIVNRNFEPPSSLF